MVVLVAVTIISNDVLVAVVIALAVCFVMFCATQAPFRWKAFSRV